MAFILAADGRDTDITAIVGLFQRYQDYLRSVEDGFPAGAFALATSDWYFNFKDHRCPHDAWLEAAKLGEHSAGLRHEIRSPYLKVRLLGAYHDDLSSCVIRG